MIPINFEVKVLMLYAECFENPLVNLHQTICILLYVFKIFLAFFQVLIIHQNDLFGSACFLSWRTCLYQQENSFICGERMGPFWTHSLWISRKVSSELLSYLTKLLTV